MDVATREFLRLLELAGWSQAEAARRLQITPGAVSQICAGKTRPSRSTLNLLRLMVAPVNPKALTLREDSAPSPLEGWERRLLESLRRLSEHQREQVLPLIHRMLALAESAPPRKLKR